MRLLGYIIALPGFLTLCSKINSALEKAINDHKIKEAEKEMSDAIIKAQQRQGTEGIDKAFRDLG